MAAAGGGSGGRGAFTFKAVGSFVPKATAKAREAHGLPTADLLLNWAAIVGPKLAAFTAPRRIRWPKVPDRLALGAGSPKSSTSGRPVAGRSTLEIWVAGGRAHEIPYLKADILNRINAYFGYRAVTDVLPVDGPIVRPAVAAKPPPPRPGEIAATAAKLKLSEDDPLERALAKLGANVARRVPAKP